MSDLSLNQVTGLTDKPDRSPLDQKNGGWCPGVVYVWLFVHLCIPVKHTFLWASNCVCGYGFVCACICISACVCLYRQGRQERERGFQVSEEVLQRSGSGFSFCVGITRAYCPGLPVAPTLTFTAVISADNFCWYASLPRRREGC